MQLVKLEKCGFGTKLVFQYEFYQMESNMQGKMTESYFRKQVSKVKETDVKKVLDKAGSILKKVESIPGLKGFIAEVKMLLGMK